MFSRQLYCLPAIPGSLREVVLFGTARECASTISTNTRSAQHHCLPNRLYQCLQAIFASGVDPSIADNTIRWIAKKLLAWRSRYGSLNRESMAHIINPSFVDWNDASDKESRRAVEAVFDAVEAIDLDLPTCMQETPRRISAQFPHTQLPTKPTQFSEKSSKRQQHSKLHA